MIKHVVIVILASGVLQVTAWRLAAAIVVSDRAWDPRVGSWSKPLDLPATDGAPAAELRAAYLLAGLPDDGMAVGPGQDTLAATLVLAFEREAAADDALTIDIGSGGAVPLARFDQLPGFDDAEELFVMDLGATDWVLASRGAESDEALFDVEDIPIWVPVPEPDEWIMLATALAVLWVAARREGRWRMAEV